MRRFLLFLLVILTSAWAEPFYLRGSNSGVAETDQGVSIRSLGTEHESRRVSLIDDIDDTDPDAPDIWDILIWAGAWIGRVARTIMVTAVKLVYALYTGIVYGWESSKDEVQD
ncbi:hypothetical protein GNI_016930 [Gregarina niphandrodes]|uniref:Transmembrane protein n=1 Tax=Gregarina niphandrodes TaxID=110365 RepID=A0A023BCB7_GRENI|nr:hypothetical protein GNI_016930 [Gregarina niphandrodes]EZG82238.1 hypothetical protein GNI_016930 [Gregarina niphandrodes]|eukprot:XP_011129019.1 hypothetical protein GNI_016930 [Gregarina niphandrodes]